MLSYLKHQVCRKSIEQSHIKSSEGVHDEAALNKCLAVFEELKLSGIKLCLFLAPNVFDRNAGRNDLPEFKGWEIYLRYNNPRSRQ